MAREKQPPIWQRLGYKNQYAYRRATGKYTPGTTGAERARRQKAAQPGRTPESRWSVRTAAGTRTLQTRSQSRALQAIRGARRNGADIRVEIHGDVDPGFYPRWKAGQTPGTARIDPDELLTLVGKHDGDLQAALNDYFSERFGAEIRSVDSYTIKEFIL